MTNKIFPVTSPPLETKTAALALAPSRVQGARTTAASKPLECGVAAVENTQDQVMITLGIDALISSIVVLLWSTTLASARA